MGSNSFLVNGRSFAQATLIGQDAIGDVVTEIKRQHQKNMIKPIRRHV